MNGVYIEMGRIRKYHFLLFFSVSLIDARLLSGFRARSRGKLRTNMRLSGSSLLIRPFYLPSGDRKPVSAGRL